MNKLALATAGLLATSMLAGPAFAASETKKPEDAAQAETTQATETAQAEPELRYGSVKNASAFDGTISGDYSAEDLMDRNISDANGNDLGEIEDLLLNQDNTVTKALVDVGGFLGIGEKRVAIDIEQLTFAEGDGEITVDMTEEQLEELPAFEYEDDSWLPMT